MYVHHGCRCDACCKAEHDYYTKRASNRNRTNSKWGEQVNEVTERNQRQKRYNKRRYSEYCETAPYKKRIRWKDLVPVFGTKCARCGIETNPDDIWETNGRKCYGRTYPTVDHIVSMRNGGRDVLENTQLLCKRCNSAKGRANGYSDNQ